MGLNLGFTISQLENSLCQPNSKWVPEAVKEEGLPCLSYAQPKIQWASKWLSYNGKP